MMAAKIGANLRMESTNGARFTLSVPNADVRTRDHTNVAGG